MSGPIYTISNETAKLFGDTEWWINEDKRKVAIYQMVICQCVMDMGDFQNIVGDVLGYNVFTHELVVMYDHILSRLLKGDQIPSISEISNYINARLYESDLVQMKQRKIL